MYLNKERNAPKIPIKYSINATVCNKIKYIYMCKLYITFTFIVDCALENVLLSNMLETINVGTISLRINLKENMNTAETFT